MAVVRTARSSPPFALIIFIFLWVVSTGVAIFFYLQNNKLDDEIRATSKQNDSLATKAERSSDPGVKDLLAAGNKNNHTAMGQALAELRTLKGILDDGGKNVDAINERFVALRKDIPGDPATAFGAIETLKTRFELAQQASVKSAQETAAAKASYETAKKDYDAHKAAFDKTNETQKTDVAKLTQQLEDAKAAKDAKVKEYEETLTKQQKDNEKAIRELVVQLQQLKEDADKKGMVVQQLRGQIEMLKPSARTTLVLEPDGRVVRSNQVTGEVYISLGRKDRATPGLTFAVYDPKLGVGSGPDSGGKAKLEVVEVGENDSLCRVTFTEKGQHVDTNDLIANPVYAKDKTRKFHFVVFGEFDLDGDGIATAAEREKIIRLIQSWGGIIDDTLSTQTDFLVMGAVTGSGAKYLSDTDQSGELAKARKAQQDKYNAMVKEARDYSIPLLNANRFLALIGYYNTTIVRY